MLTIENLRCENLPNPLCIDAERPRLSWTLASPERAKAQTAYRILVASTPELLAEGKGDLWDSGRVESSQSAQIEYTGEAMVSFRRHFWKACVWDEAGVQSDWSNVAEWTAGVLREGDWHAETIARARQPSTSGPLPRFRHAFELEKSVARAVLYSSGLGFHEIFVNGDKVGDEVLAPLWTDYRETVFYVAHDITAQLQEGSNVVAGELGNGFYNVAGGRYVKFTGSFGTLMLRAMIRIEYVDGSVSFVGTNRDWKSNTGLTIFSCIHGGEDYDARLEQPGWSDVGFDDSEWGWCGFDGEPGGVFRAQTAAPQKVMENIPAVAMSRPEGALPVYEFEKNFAGWPKLRVRGKAGASIRLRTSESLDENGELDTTSVLGPGYEGEGISFGYVLKGKDIEEWHPRFSYTGFRYAEVTIEGEAEILSMEGQFVHSATSRAGQFTSSSTLFNRIDELVDNAVRSNFQAVLTDCPHREKLGWQEVGYLMGPSIMYHYDAEHFFEKIVMDTADAQLTNGLVPDICPEYTVFRGPYRDTPEWGSSTVILPWMLYRWRGDVRVLENNYATMVRYVDYLTSKAEHHIVKHGLGDWYDIGPGYPGPSKLTTQGLTGTATYYYDLRVLAKTAQLLGKMEESGRYAALSEQVCARFNETFFDPDKGFYGTGSQAAQAMPLVFGMVPDEHRESVVGQLVHDVESRGDQQTAGDVGFRYLIRALTDAGRSDLLYRMNIRTNEPSYGCMIENGVTSLPEAWDGNPLQSQNHCMLGHIQEWFMSGLVGINQEEDSIGFERIVINPAIPQGLEKVSGYYDSVRGRIESEWAIEGDIFTLRVQIPANSSARIFIPAEGVQEGGVPVEDAPGITAVERGEGYCVVSIGSGEYHFKTETNKKEIES